MPELEGRAPPAVALEKYQFQWAGQMVFGEGTWCIVEDVVDFIFEVEGRVADVLIPGAHGAVMLPYYAAPITTILPLRVLAAPHSQQMVDQLDTVKAMFPLDTARREKALRWRMAGRQWVRYARCSRMRIEASPLTARLGAVPVTVALTCTDPRYYTDEIASVVLSPYNPAGPGGWELGGDLPLNNAAPVVPPGDLTATNEGNSIAWPLIRVYLGSGELSSLEIEVVNDLADYECLLSLDFGDTPPAAPATVVIDMDAYVRVTGTTPIRVENPDGTSESAFAAWQHPRQPLGLPPGESVVRFMPVGTTDATCRVDYRSTWL